MQCVLYVYSHGRNRISVNSFNSGISSCSVEINNNDFVSAKRRVIRGHLSMLSYLSLCVRKPTIWVPTRSDTNRSVQSKKMVRGWKFWI